MTTTGTQSEAQLAFGGLHQLLFPFLDRVDHLPDPQRKAVDVAFGVSEGDAPDAFLAERDSADDPYMVGAVHPRAKPTRFGLYCSNAPAWKRPP